jgi:Fe-S oxidoreductase/nitrate reductase gamma subunit
MAIRPRPKPSQLLVVVGAGLAIVTAASGIIAAVEGWHDKSPVSREVFLNVPGALQVVFYTLLPLLFLWAAWQLSLRARNWERGAPDRRLTTRRNLKRRVEEYRRGVYMQTLLRDSAAGLMHSLIYFPFLILFAVTAVLEVDHQLPPSLKFLHGTTYQAYKFVGDSAGALFLIGVTWAIVRRYVLRPYRIRIKSRPEDAMVLGTLFTIGATGLLAQGFRIALVGRPDFEKWAFIGYPLSAALEHFGHLETWHQALWVTHVAAFFLFVTILPITKMRHMFTSPINMYLSDRDRPKGAMKPLPNLAETELETFGANAIEDFTWKQLLDTDACTMCGRCTSVCPAHATGKPLDPREIVLKIGHVMSATGTPPVSPPLGQDAELTVTANSVFERITAEEVWACTTCKACDEICPVNIEILDKILDMRRYLSLIESNFPTELGKAYRAMENQSNPWALNNDERGDWARSLPTEVPIVDPSGPLDHEYLFWVGCAGSFDDKARKVTMATAKLLQRAGIDFAILGPSELCTGDPARRSGNEYIFQMLAGQNVATLNGMGVKKIITLCPHCFNTLGNEYPQLGGHYEVVHHSQLLEWLISTGKLDMGGASLEERIVYHDSCYLGRHNDIYAAPRKVLGSLKGIEIVEAPRNGTKGMCCGAGGARMWMEESIGKKVNTERSRELIATGAARVATACPYCYVMMDDGVKENGADDIIVQDISMHLLEAIEAGERERADGQSVPDPASALATGVPAASDPH